MSCDIRTIKPRNLTDIETEWQFRMFIVSPSTHVNDHPLTNDQRHRTLWISVFWSNKLIALVQDTLANEFCTQGTQAFSCNRFAQSHFRLRFVPPTSSVFPWILSKTGTPDSQTAILMNREVLPRSMMCGRHYNVRQFWEITVDIGCHFLTFFLFEAPLKWDTMSGYRKSV